MITALIASHVIVLLLSYYCVTHNYNTQCELSSMLYYKFFIYGHACTSPVIMKQFMLFVITVAFLEGRCCDMPYAAY